MILKFKSILLGLTVFSLCQACQSKKELPVGIWHAEIETVIGHLPFDIEINANLETFVINGDERLKLDTTFLRNDSLVILMEVFEAEIVTAFDSGEMNGFYSKKLGDLTEVGSVFRAEKGLKPRFKTKEAKTAIDVSGKWEVTFVEDSSSSYPAIGVFEQTDNKVNGTFLTETGDYRYLDGNIVGDSLMLSCFDGTHVFLFKALIDGDELIRGRFSYSLDFYETWTAKRNENATLKSPEELTYLKEGYEGIEFNFKNTKGEEVIFPSDAYNGKLVILQILGSWCPNCMDETKFLTKWYERQDKSKVAIIGLAFEKSLDPTYAYPKIDKMVKRFGVNYPVLLAGSNDKEKAIKSLPMLNQIISFPTAIFIDKAGKVRKVHTGFSGPGTGQYYTKFVEDFGRFTEKLIAE